MFFNGFQPLLRIAIIGVAAYVLLVLLLRLTGKRTLSKMNAFDFVVTVALGSTLATIILSKDVVLAEGLLALGVLVGMQYVVAWLSARFEWVDQLVKATPALLAYRGRLLHDALRRERVSEDEVISAIRSAGMNSLEEAEAVVLETSGDFSVLPRSTAGESSALDKVSGIGPMRTA